MYKNEGPCGEAIRNSGLDRSQIFYTTKIPRDAMGYEKAKAAIESSLAEAKVDYIDLYVVIIRRFLLFIKEVKIINKEKGS